MEKLIVGIDEAGRGPLAGRVYAAAVILNPKKKISGLNDSKKLTPFQREKLFIQIAENSLAFSVSYSEVDEIEKMNILNATFLAMKRALSKINYKFDHILVDGRDFPFGIDYKGNAVIRGDEIIPSIMAASILAKVSRDRYMNEMHFLYPEYQFYRHKGYPTKLHFKLLKKFGPCDIHRKTYHGVKEFFE